MAKNNKEISSKQKTLILAEALVPGCIISKLAKSHGISKGTIYTWIKKSQNPQINKSNTENSSIDNSFVEINLINTKNQTNCKRPAKPVLIFAIMLVLGSRVANQRFSLSYDLVFVRGHVLYHFSLLNIQI